MQCSSSSSEHSSNMASLFCEARIRITIVPLMGDVFRVEAKLSETVLALKKLVCDAASPTAALQPGDVALFAPLQSELEMLDERPLAHYGFENGTRVPFMRREAPEEWLAADQMALVHRAFAPVHWEALCAVVGALTPVAPLLSLSIGTHQVCDEASSVQLAQALRENSTLHDFTLAPRVWLDRDGFMDAARSVPLLGALGTSKTLRSRSLARVRLADLAVVALAESLRRNRSLERLDASQCEVEFANLFLCAIHE